MDGEGRRPHRAQGQGRPRLQRQAVSRSSASPASAAASRRRRSSIRRRTRPSRRASRSAATAPPPGTRRWTPSCSASASRARRTTPAGRAPVHTRRPKVMTRRRRPRRPPANDRRGREGRPRALALEGLAPAVAAGSAGERRPQLQLPRRCTTSAAEVRPPRRRRAADREPGAEGQVRGRLRRPRVRADGQPRRPPLPRRLRRRSRRPASASSRSSARAGTTARRRTASRSSTTRTATSTSTTWRPARRRTSPWACRPRSSTSRTTTTSSSRRPQPIGWVKDSKAVLISDNWDIWQVPVDGGAAVNLTVNGKKDQIRYQQPLRARARRGPRRRHRPVEAAVLPRLRRVDEEGRHRAPRSGQGRADQRARGATRRSRG